MTQRRVNEVRLAARAVLEWKTPPRSATYQSVLRAILSLHPFAAQMGLHHNHSLFQLDDQGVLFVYLLETLGESELDHAREIGLDPLRHRVTAVLAKFFEATVLGVNDQPVWPNGPLKSQVADAVAHGIARHDRGAERALLAMAIPLSLTLRQVLVAAIKPTESPNWTMLQEISKLTPRVTFTHRCIRQIGIWTPILGIAPAIKSDEPMAVGCVLAIGIVGCAAICLPVSWLISVLLRFKLPEPKNFKRIAALVRDDSFDEQYWRHVFVELCDSQPGVLSEIVTGMEQNRELAV